MRTGLLRVSLLCLVSIDSVKNLLQAMSELTAPERRDFLQFVTGSPKLPIGGESTGMRE